MWLMYFETTKSNFRSVVSWFIKIKKIKKPIEKANMVFLPNFFFVTFTTNAVNVTRPFTNIPCSLYHIYIIIESWQTFKITKHIIIHILPTNIQWIRAAENTLNIVQILWLVQHRSRFRSRSIQNKRVMFAQNHYVNVIGARMSYWG